MKTTFKLTLFLLSAVCVVLECFGAYEMVLKQESGHISYLVIAAPLAALYCALIPAAIVHCWRQKCRTQAMMWLASWPLALALIFFAAAERVHLTKAGAYAQREASRSAVTQAETALSDAKAALSRAEQDSREARKLPRQLPKKAKAGAQFCDQGCLKRFEVAETAARGVVAEKEAAVTAARAVAITEAPYTAPVWLLPVILSVLSFLGILTGMHGSKIPAPAPVVVKAKRTRRKARKQQPKPKAPTPGVVINFRARQPAKRLVANGN
jgi:hypothetical protein